MTPPPFARLLAGLAARHPRQFCAGGCHERAQAACDALAACGFQARASERLPAEAFGYEPQDVWVHADGSHSIGQPSGRPGSLHVQRPSGHFVCLAEHGGRTCVVDLAAGQFGIEEHPAVSPLPAHADTIAP